MLYGISYYLNGECICVYLYLHGRDTGAAPFNRQPKLFMVFRKWLTAKLCYILLVIVWSFMYLSIREY